MEAFLRSGVLAYMSTMFVPTLAGATSKVKVNPLARMVAPGMVGVGVAVAGGTGSGTRGCKHAVVVAAPAKTMTKATTSRRADVGTGDSLTGCVDQHNFS
jgi:hypothetical protein